MSLGDEVEFVETRLTHDAPPIVEQLEREWERLDAELEEHNMKALKAQRERDNLTNKIEALKRQVRK